MAIPETQLTTWSAQGSVTQSSATYTTLKNILHNNVAPYASRSFDSFLQGSYGNDTNIYADSDVDIVMRLDAIYYYNLDNLPDDQKTLFKSTLSPVQYDVAQFKADITSWLTQKYGTEVVPGNKAIFIKANGARRDADVLPAAQYRKYTSYTAYQQNYVEGICFFLPNGSQIVNYPKLHSENCTAKHQATNEWFKPMVRIIKNMRNRMIEVGTIKEGLAPSYYLEGLFYNVPSDKFGKSYGDTFAESINWILKADRSQFLCANRQYYLLRENSSVCWSPARCDEFLNAAVELWKAW